MSQNPFIMGLKSFVILHNIQLDHMFIVTSIWRVLHPFLVTHTHREENIECCLIFEIDASCNNELNNRLSLFTTVSIQPCLYFFLERFLQRFLLYIVKHFPLLVRREKKFKNFFFFLHDNRKGKFLPKNLIDFA